MESRVKEENSAPRVLERGKHKKMKFVAPNTLIYLSRKSTKTPLVLNVHDSIPVIERVFDNHYMIKSSVR